MESKVINFLLKDNTLLCAHAVFYALMFITYRIVIGLSYDLYRIYHESFNNFIVIFLVATLLVEVILFVSMLIKLFTKPKTHQLTSYLGLFIGVFICFIWFGILIVYFAANNHRGFEGLGFALTSLLPCVSSGCGYILLIFIKAIRSFICLLSQ